MRTRREGPHERPARGEGAQIAMDLSFAPAEEAFRTEARAWLRAHVPRELPPSGSQEGFAAHVAWERQLHAAGWSVVAWPRAFGGRDASILEWLIFEEEYYLAGA